jgi:hypothetical protein
VPALTEREYWMLTGEFVSCQTACTVSPTQTSRGWDEPLPSPTSSRRLVGSHVVPASSDRLK